MAPGTCCDFVRVLSAWHLSSKVPETSCDHQSDWIGSNLVLPFQVLQIPGVVDQVLLVVKNPDVPFLGLVLVIVDQYLAFVQLFCLHFCLPGEASAKGVLDQDCLARRHSCFEVAGCFSENPGAVSHFQKIH